jgi:hypothetical protein
MDQKLLINHARFKKKPKVGGDTGENKYPDFFNNYAKKNYVLVDNNCLCGKNNDQLIANYDRYSVKFDTVICKNCGLIRALKYFSEENVSDFYKNHYRDIANQLYILPHKIYEKQIEQGLKRYELIKEKSNVKIEGLKILDLGGGAGGTLEHFKNLNDVYLADFHDPYLDYAKGKGIYVIKGGLKEISFKPDIIIFSHVIEHWNNFENEIKNLINIQKINKTINYIEFPGVDSLKLGRREGDFFKDIHIPHVYYFSSYVFENLMNRYGFEKLYIDSSISSLFIYTGVKKELKNHFNQVKDDLLKAEFTRKKQIIKKIIKIFIPEKILSLRLRFKKWFKEF